ncbi:hypothetical protein Tco_0659257 [Tanacetum coccineum]
MLSMNRGHLDVIYKKRKGKSKSTNGGQFIGPSVKQNVRYEPKTATNAPIKGATYVGNTSQSSSMLKTTRNSPKKDNLSMSNSISALNDEEEDDEEVVENVHDESVNLIQNTKASGSSSFTGAADTHKVKLDLENKVRQEQALVIQRNMRNAELVQENDLLKSTLSGKEKSIAFLQSEKEKILSEKKDLADSYLDEIVCLKNANKVARDMLQRFNMPTQTIPMLSKKPKAATADLHKDLLGTRNPGLGYMAKRAQPVLYDADTLLHPTHHPVSIWDSEEVLVHQVVSMKKMNEKPGHVRPENGFYEKLNALKFVPQQELSREQAYWLPANEIASQASNPNSPVTPFVS